MIGVASLGTRTYPAGATSLKEPFVRRRFVILTLFVVVLSLVGASAAFAAGKPHVYRGRTSQDLRIQFALVKNNHGALLMREVQMGITLTCEDTSVQQWGLGIGTYPGERLSGHDLTFDSVDTSMAIHVAGTFKRDAASGTLTTNLAALDANEQAQLCSTGDLTWTAHRSTKTLGPFAGYSARGPVHVHRLAGGAVARFALRT